MMDRLRLFRWIDEFMEGNFDADDVKTQIRAGWYDWFCKDSSLANKTKKMGNIIKQVKKAKRNSCTTYEECKRWSEYYFGGTGKLPLEEA